MCDDAWAAETSDVVTPRSQSSQSSADQNGHGGQDFRHLIRSYEARILHLAHLLDEQHLVLQTELARAQGVRGKLELDALHASAKAERLAAELVEMTRYARHLEGRAGVA